jgi:hypothetical protein
VSVAVEPSNTDAGEAGTHNPGPQLGQQAFERVQAMIYRHAGISLKAGKMQMVHSRLLRRLRALRMDSFDRYLDQLDRAGADSPEWQEFVNALTTNLTSFFREQYHFPVLSRLRLPEVGDELELVEALRCPFPGQGIAADPAGGLVGIDRFRRRIVFAERE